MNSPQAPSVAIIGAGLSGLALALALHQQQIPCTIYETQPQPLDIGGAIMLSPNGLRVLDRLGIYERLLPLAYRFQNLHFYTSTSQLLDTFPFGSAQKHSYDGLRIYRSELIQLLLSALSEAGITPVYGRKFLHVDAETASGVTFSFADGSSASASLLVGADGIHSRVRTYIAPFAVPTFTHMMGVTAAVPAAQLALSPADGVVLPLTVTNATHGAFVAAPQRPDASEVLIGRQCRVAGEPDREGWARMAADKGWCVDVLRQGGEEYPAFVRRAVAHVDVDKVNLWPFYVVPKLESWVSEGARVVILGDAAHAIPPTAGQGVNQAFEDVYVFAKVLGRVRGDGEGDLREVFGKWQRKRQARVDGVLALNARLNKRRLPAEEGKEKDETEVFDLDWLYDVDFEKILDE